MSSTAATLRYWPYDTGGHRSTMPRFSCKRRQTRKNRDMCSPVHSGGSEWLFSFVLIRAFCVS